MKKIRNVIVAALLVLPLLTLEASTLTNPSAASSIKPTRADTCYFYYAGVYWPYPC